VALIHPEDRERVASSLSDHLQHRAVYDLEFRVRHKAGHYEWMRARGQAERRGRWHAAAIGRAMQLITDRKLAEQARSGQACRRGGQSSQEQFPREPQSRNRTPMNGVIGMSQILAETPLDHTQREYLDIIRGSAKALLALINDVLDLSKIELTGWNSSTLSST